ncbi:5-formyltetrahydrofolate cyclo-ligase [Akkermansiaceae bacterium]|nr:5-formyltetrahydrofolate cyclo-ligase [Akkermansiaceae bacterium]MDB4288301.1 5-formyltetrahydrofolate cyclo-ligase [bacterium]MDA7629810.1 5-formyltetrahydrofolate cyclo-ligase [Akkermansiaceae bacterium]MDB4615427.1 5-formyltetrahydrofolate cyclo-ligase [Akkermansiaceae bacterium]MDB4667211.1 5-formyltetrahydrofolate cyclo-ligase [Akkermansiaceae bacterium]
MPRQTCTSNLIRAILAIMSTDASHIKALLRKAMRIRVAGLTSEEKTAQSEILRGLIPPLAGKTCAIFAGTENEPDLLPLVELFPDTRWLFPKVTGEGTMEFYPVNSTTELLRGSFGIREPSEGEPVNPLEIDTIICPGLAFTKNGARLGQGGGFYDRFLAQVPQANIYGACFTEQVVPKLPLDQHDLTVTRVIHSTSFGT